MTIATLTPTKVETRVEMTKVRYFALPLKDRRKHKDGKCFARIRRGKESSWVEVFWKS